jgi:anaerobic nitric oxide reductase transcription regulator
MPVVSLPAVSNLRSATDDFQRQIIINTLSASAGNWAACARQLQLDVGNLHRLAKRLGVK